MEHASESNVVSQKVEIWDEFISGMLHLAKAQCYDEGVLYTLQEN